MTTFFEWETRYNLDIPDMDAEHQRIIDCMNLLHDLHQSKADYAKLERALIDLARVTAHHFADEEVFMEKIGFADSRKHAMIHKSLLDRLLQYRRAFERDRKFTEDFFFFLKMWLKSHICGIDAKYAAHLRAA